MKDFMNEDFDHEAEFDEKIAPHISAIRAECIRLGLPMLISVVYANSQQEVGTNIGNAVAVNLIGPERTPPGLYVAERAVLNDGEGIVSRLMATGLIGAESRELSRESMVAEGAVN